MRRIIAKTVDELIRFPVKVQFTVTNSRSRPRAGPEQRVRGLADINGFFFSHYPDGDIIPMEKGACDIGGLWE